MSIIEQSITTKTGALPLERQTTDEVHRYLSSLLVGDGIMLENTGIRNYFYLVSFAIFTFYLKLLNFKLHFNF